MMTIQALEKAIVSLENKVAKLEFEVYEQRRTIGQLIMEKADRKTEPSAQEYEKWLFKEPSRAEQTEPQRNMAEDIVESFGFKTESYRQAKAKDEPQTERSEG